MSKVELELVEPRWPKFIMLKMPPGRREDGFIPNGPKVSVGNLNASQIDWLVTSLRAHCTRTREQDD